MECYGFKDIKKDYMELDKADKGHAIEIDLFADAILNDTESPNNVIKASRAAVISFLVNDSIKSGLPVSIKNEDYNF